MPVDLHCQRFIATYAESGRHLVPVFRTLMQRISRRLNRAQPPEVMSIDGTSGDAIKAFLVRMFGEHNLYLGDVAYWNAEPENLSPDRLDHYIRRQPLVPFLQTFYMEFLIPKVYNLIEHHWYLDCEAVLTIPMDAFQHLGQLLLDSVYAYGWDDVFFRDVETCSLCDYAMFLTRFRGRCGHMFHRDCIEIGNPETCPECHDPGF